MKYKMSKVGRNDPCPCGSGLKFKKCCLGKEEQTGEDLKTTYANKYKIRIKDPEEIEGIRKAGQLVVETLDMIESHIRPGLTSD